MSVSPLPKVMRVFYLPNGGWGKGEVARGFEAKEVEQINPTNHIP
jgi:hypothetical protein